MVSFALLTSRGSSGLARAWPGTSSHLHYQQQLISSRLVNSTRTLRTTSSSPQGGGMATELAHQHAGLLKRLVSGVDVDSLTDRETTRVSHGFKAETWTGGDDRFWWGMAAAKGRRPGMEDAHAVDLDMDSQTHTALFGIFDGHAGKEVATFCARHMVTELVGSPSYGKGDLEAALPEAFLRLEELMKDQANQQELYNLRHDLKPLHEEHQGPDDYRHYGHFEEGTGRYLGPKAGCTACVALLRDDQLYVGAVGDSRCVLSRGDQAVLLTQDHKPSIPSEAERVQKAGLAVFRNRVVGEHSSLAMTRALGDAKYKQPGLPPHKQAVSPIPDTAVTQVSTDPEDQAPAGAEAGAAAAGPGGGQQGAQAAAVPDFLVLACDGVWDVMENQAVINFVSTLLQRGYSPKDAAIMLVDECLAAEGTVTPASTDNVTALIVVLQSMPAEG